MLSSYHLYSDISLRGRNCGFAWLLTYGKSRYLCRTGVMFEPHSHVAELACLLRGLQQAPPRGELLVHSDVAGVEGWLAGSIKFPARNRKSIEAIRRAIASRGNVTVEFVPRGKRSHFYQLCHLAARRALATFEQHRSIDANAFAGLVLPAKPALPERARARA